MPAAFPVSLVIRALPPEGCGGSRQRYELERDFVFRSKAFGTLTVPAGLLTDFASVPRLVWTYLSPEDPCILFASIVHDWLYSVRGHLPLRRLTRAECDAILHEAMLVCGARRRQAWLAHRAHRAVRLFGGSRWQESD